MLASSHELDVGSWLGLLSRVVVGGEVEIPEFDVKLGGGADSGQSNVTTFRCPNEGVYNLAIEVLDLSKVAFLWIELVKVHVVLDNRAGDVLPVVWVIGGDDGEAGTGRFPGELRDVILSELNRLQ